MELDLVWELHGNVAIAAFGPDAGGDELAEALRRSSDNKDIAALVLLGDPKGFIPRAGLDAQDIPVNEPALADSLLALRELTIPVTAAIEGGAFNGGLQIALVCDNRVALPQAKFGLGEFKAGLIPGASGTQTLPRIIGSEAALEMIVAGRVLSAEEAVEAGLVHRIAADDLRAAAIAMADRGKAVPPAENVGVALSMSDADFESFRGQYARKLGKQDAFSAAIEAVRAAQHSPRPEGAERERELFATLAQGPQHAALRYAKLAQRQASHIPALKGVTPRTVGRVGVIGSGTMGSGIAIAFLSNGYPVALFERDAEALQRGEDRIRKTIGKSVSSGRLSSDQAARALAGFETSLRFESLSSADLVIEAAFETLEVKQSIFAELDRVAKPGAVLATNTSYLDIAAIADATARPGDVLGLHFFSPANIMKLLEIVRTERTAADAITTAFAVARRIGKTPVLAGNAYGFIGNRMMAVRRMHAESMVVEGADIARIDFLMEDFGLPMGPFRIGDLAGLDLGWSAGSSNGATVRERLCEAGRRGQKTGAGFYDYDDAMKPIPSREAQAIIAQFARDSGISQREFDDAEILDRLLWPMVDEGTRLLAEGIALRESDIDVVWLNGFGWPAWKGGPMFHARRTGLEVVCQRLEALGCGPSPALRQLINRSPACG